MKPSATAELKARVSRTLRVALILLCLGAASFPARGAKFTASLDRTSVVIGEPVTLTLSFEGGQPQEVSGLPAIDGIQTTSGVSTRHQTRVDSGGATTVTSYSVELVPTRAGEFVIPPFIAKVGGETLTSQPITLKVASSDPSAPPPQYADQPVFLWMVLPKTELFVGETLIAEFRLYLRSDVRRYGDLKIPLAGDGFTASRFVERGHFQRRVGPHRFTIVPFSVALTPVRTGTLTIGPIEGSVTLNPPDVFDFSFNRPQQVSLNVGPQTLQIVPLPTENVPPQFNGAVGNFTLTVSAGPTNVATGDPVTVRIQIAGSGQLDTLALPEQTDWHDFKVYPPTSKVEPTDPFGVQGTKAFEQIVIPQTTGIRELPAIAFSFFDPASKAYRTLTHPPIPLTVRAGGSVDAPSMPAVARRETPSEDILPIKQRPGTLAAIASPLITRPGFLALQSVPLIALISVFLWRKHGEALARNPRLRRQRRVDRIVRDGVGQLRRSAAANQSDEFFATLFRLLQERLGERLDLPASAITESVIEEQLQPRGVPEAALADLHELFQTCNLARYAPVKTSQELQAFIPKIETVLANLRSLKT